MEYDDPKEFLRDTGDFTEEELEEMTDSEAMGCIALHDNWGC